MGLIPEEIIAQVLDRCDIVATISGYIPLKRAGRNFKANCPFHHEKTPSFVVNPDKQIFHCFGCGIGGNVISFLMHQERLEFPEAVRTIAQKHGIVIPTENRFEAKAQTHKETLFKVNDLATQFFHQALLSPQGEGTPARKYLKDRGVKLEIVQKFKLGFAPEKWDSLLVSLKGKNIDLSTMEKAGLIIPRENRDGFYDRFRDRITFPIFDIRTRCVGFGARTMKEEDTAKYINSPETPLYIKGKHLYGFQATKEAIQEKDFAIVVEGYMDFIIPFQAGVDNIVASLGTALTTDQIRLLRRYTQNVVMLFDMDAAGENATVRNLDLLIEEGMNVKVATLTSGDDPDSFVRKNGIEKFNDRIAQALSLFDYKMKILLGRYSHKTPEGKAKISTEMLSTIGKFNNAVIKFSYIKQLALLLSVPEEALLTELQKGSVSSTREMDSLQNTVVTVFASGAERNILRLILEDETFIPLIKEDVALSDFRDERIRSIIEQIFELATQGKNIRLSNIMGCFQDQKTLQMISQLMASEDIVIADKEKIYRDCINRIKSDRIKLVRQDLSQQIKLAETSGDENRLHELKEKFNQLIKR